MRERKTLWGDYGGTSRLALYRPAIRRTDTRYTQIASHGSSHVRRLWGAFTDIAIHSQRRLHTNVPMGIMFQCPWTPKRTNEVGQRQGGHHRLRAEKGGRSPPPSTTHPATNRPAGSARAPSVVVPLETIGQHRLIAPNALIHIPRIG